MYDNVESKTCLYCSCYDLYKDTELLELAGSCRLAPLEGDKLCLFHSRNIKKDVKAFWNGIQEKLERKNFDFEGFCFPPDAVADFSGKEFKRANFSEAIFKGDVDFSEAIFPGNTHFSEASFLGEHTEFGMAIFSGEITDFGGAHFSGNSTHFIGAQFLGKTVFGSVTFSGEHTIFSMAKFLGKNTHFDKAKFSGHSTDFSGVEFSGKNTFFSSTKFSSKFTNFYEAKFSGKTVSFNETEFSGEITDFIRVTFYECSKIFFVDTVFKSECHFLNTKFPLMSDQFAIFRGTIDPLDISNVLFLYSNYDRIIFRNCRFQEGLDDLFDRKFPLWRRKVILYDESFIGEQIRIKEREQVKNKTKKVERIQDTDIRQKVEYAHVEALYRQFKKNLEVEKDWGGAGEFHYGEMECKRKALSWFWKNFGLLAWYKYFSGYGERPLRAFCWIVFIMLFFAFVYWSADLLKDGFHTFSDYLWYSVKSTFLQRIGEKISEPAGFCGKFALVLQSVLGPTLIALFILALKRKVRR